MFYDAHNRADLHISENSWILEYLSEEDDDYVDEMWSDQSICTLAKSFLYSFHGASFRPHSIVEGSTTREISLCIASHKAHESRAMIHIIAAGGTNPCQIHFASI